MARISKQALSEQQQADLSRQLTEVIARMDIFQTQNFLSEFFGKEEKIMFAKRLAIIVLLHHDRPIHRIATYLHVSEATVLKLHHRYERGEFNCTLETLHKNKKVFTEFIAILEAILTVGGTMPYKNYVIKQKR